MVAAETTRDRVLMGMDAAILSLSEKVNELRAEKDGAYLERNRCVALIARMAIALGYDAGLAKTDIPGWDPAWHGCAYVDLPTGQASWHYHVSSEHLFADLPAYTKPWDNHTTVHKYRRVHHARFHRIVDRINALSAEVEADTKLMQLHIAARSAADRRAVDAIFACKSWQDRFDVAEAARKKAEAAHDRRACRIGPDCRYSAFETRTCEAFTKGCPIHHDVPKKTEEVTHGVGESASTMKNPTQASSATAPKQAQETDNAEGGSRATVSAPILCDVTGLCPRVRVVLGRDITWRAEQLTGGRWVPLAEDTNMIKVIATARWASEFLVRTGMGDVWKPSSANTPESVAATRSATECASDWLTRVLPLDVLTLRGGDVVRDFVIWSLAKVFDESVAGYKRAAEVALGRRDEAELSLVASQAAFRRDRTACFENGKRFALDSELGRARGVSDLHPGATFTHAGKRYEIVRVPFGPTSLVDGSWGIGSEHAFELCAKVVSS